MNGTRDEVFALARCAERDAHVEWVSRAMKVIALAKIDHAVGFDLDSGN